MKEEEQKLTSVPVVHSLDYLLSLSYLPCSKERGDEITFPIKELIFFPKSKNKCTMVKE